MSPLTIAWLDYSEEERQRMQELVGLFGEQTTLDDLGIGTIRDSISNSLFPGTSTLHTRARYFLFIPWIFRKAEHDAPEQLVAKAQNLERRLIGAVKDEAQKGENIDGLIGINAGPNLRTLPSTMYWSALQSYGIFTAPAMSISQYGRVVARGGAETEFEAELGDRRHSFWHRDIPPAPENFLRFSAESNRSFKLTADEAEWLCNRILSSGSPDSEGPSLLSALVKDIRLGRTEILGDAPWSTDLPAGTTAKTTSLLSHGRQFSLAVEGAALLYNLMLAEHREQRLSLQAEKDTLVATSTYKRRLAEWVHKANVHDHRSWANDSTEFLAALPNQGAGIANETRTFVIQWMNELARNGLDVADSENAREIVERREKEHKLGQARFNNLKRLEAWEGESGTAPLTYRWKEVRQTLQDIADGLHTEEDR